MSSVRRVGDLEVAENRAFERREQKLQTLGRVGMAVFIIAALAGLFGTGPISRTRIDQPDGSLSAEYERFGRALAPASLIVTVPPGAVRSGELRLWVDRDYLKGVQVEDISPSPESVESGRDRLTYVFVVPATSGPVTVVFRCRLQVHWLRSGRIGVESGPELGFTQFVYP